MKPSLSLSEYDKILRHDLMTFIQRCFQELNPAQKFSDATYLQLMATKLSDCLLGHGSRRLIISLPPRSLKSISVSVAAVAWMLGRDPTKRIICASYGQDLADKHARDTRTIMASDFYHRVFPGAVLSKKNSVNDFETTRQGFRMATSVNGVLTGRGGDILILDDILKPDDALSDTRRDSVNEWYDNTLLSRLNNKETGIIIIVMQRLHQDDLIGHVQERGEEWDVLSFPAIAEKDEEYVMPTALIPFRYVRKIGDVLDSSRESLQTLERIRMSIGSYNFAS